MENQRKKEKEKMKVWILERFYSIEELQKVQADVYEFGRSADTEGQQNVWSKVFDRYTELIRNNPNGIWSGIEGKINYRDFCYCARQAIERNKDSRLRVVTADITDDAKYWTGYKNPVVNEKVLRYLCATL